MILNIHMVDMVLQLYLVLRVGTSIELLLNVLPTLDKTKYELIDITNYHKMTLKEIEKELGYKSN